MLDRTDFGITAYPHSIGHGVSLWLEIEAVRDDSNRTREANDAAQ
jgi:hypothetical protein